MITAAFTTNFILVDIKYMPDNNCKYNCIYIYARIYVPRTGTRFYYSVYKFAIVLKNIREYTRFIILLCLFICV